MQPRLTESALKVSIAPAIRRILAAANCRMGHRLDSRMKPLTRANLHLLVLPLFALFFLAACAPALAEPNGLPLRIEKLREIDLAVQEAIDNRSCPGGVLWFEHRGSDYHKAYGSRALIPQPESMTEDTIFDLASLTKVVACTPAVMLLVERRMLSLEEPVQTYVPEFKGEGKEKITLRHLLTHTSGLRPGIETRSGWRGQGEAVRKACAEAITTSPGLEFRYSDINFLMLGEIVQRVARLPLEQFVAREIYAPLKMVDTRYLPPSQDVARIAPTEVVDGKPFRGTVHDPTSRLMGGVAGHAGLFSTAADLARYCRMLLNEGTLDGVRIFAPETVRLMTSVQSAASVRERRGLGWDIDSDFSGPRGQIFPVGSYGHTGWTGTSIWVDPFSQSFVIFLSNRNHPDENGTVASLRRRLGTLAAEAIADYNFSYVPGALSAKSPGTTNGISAAVIRPRVEPQTLSGIDVLAKRNYAPLKGLRVGLITNHTGQDRYRNPTIDLLSSAPGVELKALFSPEHGARGALDERIGDTVDEKTGLPVFSLYGESLKPSAAQLQDLDALVFDIQDVGCRFYTYISTMAMALEAAGENGKKFFVLDRVNPLNGNSVEGPVLTAKPTFVGYHRVPLRYGMTVGELARMFKVEHNCSAELEVIPLQNWKRGLWFDQTGLPWTNPSPNMRNLTEAILYPGIGLLESAVSVGRGTDTPFEVVGAPYVDDVRFAAELNAGGLEGIRFIPVQFTPASSIHKGELCKGVYLLLEGREQCQVVDVGILVAQTLYRLYPREFHPEKIDRLLLDAVTLDAIKSSKPLKEIHAAWQPELDEFQKRRARYLLY